MFTKSELDYAQFDFETVYLNLQGQVVRRNQRQATYQQLDLGQGVTLDLVLIPEGRFWMGSPDQESDRQPNEAPQHEVVVPSFWIGKYLVTQAQYEAVMGANPSNFQGYGSRPIDQVGLRFKAENRPVEGVTWYEAVEFCDRLSQQLGQPYRLPSEAEWEYACRADTSTPFYFGPSINAAVANYGGNFPYGVEPEWAYGKVTTEVGRFPPNSFGLYDMHGNVWEWCLDHHHQSYEDAPIDGSAWVTDGDGSLRICRGGSWDASAGSCRSAFRHRFSPDFGSPYVGLRLAGTAHDLDPSPKGPTPIKEVVELIPVEPSYPTFSFEVVTVNAKGKLSSREQRSAPYQRVDLGQGVTLDLVLIPGGTFQMGQTDGEKTKLIRQFKEAKYNQWYARELHQHQVTVPSFWMGKYPVTQVQWRSLMGKNPSEFKRDSRPVENISWEDGMKFCDLLSQKLGQLYTLPSEAQWEYACRAGTNTPFHFGETITTDLANYHGTNWEDGGKTYPGVYGQGPKGEYRKESTDVGSFPPNAFGLYDMHGNVWEWCLDLWHDSYKDAPTDGSAWTTGNSSYRVHRGGSWSDIPGKCRSAYRNGFYFSRSSINGGLRVVSLSTGA